MPLPTFAQLFAQADTAAPGIGIAAAGAADPTVLQALREATDRGWVRPILCGDEQAIRDIGTPLDGMTLIDTAAPARSAVDEIRAGRASILMKGQIATPDLMQAVLSRDHGLRTGRVICQVVLMEIVPHQRAFLMADTGITPQPTLQQKIDILESAVTLAHGLGEPCPRVAMMAASEKATEALPDTLDAAELQRQSETGQRSGCVIQGPLSFDLAYASTAGERKGISGAATGAADIMIFPELTSANLTVKAIMYTADCRFGGVLCGAACPVVFMSRADDAPTRLRSIALALAASDQR